MVNEENPDCGRSKTFPTLFSKTPKEYIAELPRWTFKGRIIVVQSQSEAKRAVKVLSRYPILGIDTETRPSFRKGMTHKVSLLQIATYDLCFLFRLNFLGMTPELISLLSDKKICKVGVSLADDRHALLQRARSLKVDGWIDLQELAPRLGTSDLSLQKLFANLLHGRISKSARLSNWEADVLTDAQKLYAATDAAACLLLYDEINRLLSAEKP